jgi:cation diffusion facilitator CzcD-associated flavoprotein CzcO
MKIKRVAVIGLGPSGAITVDALAQEQAFAIRVFERREAPGGCWYGSLSPYLLSHQAFCSQYGCRFATRHFLY